MTVISLQIMQRIFPPLPDMNEKDHSLTHRTELPTALVDVLLRQVSKTGARGQPHNDMCRISIPVRCDTGMVYKDRDPVSGIYLFNSIDFP